MRCAAVFGRRVEMFACFFCLLTEARGPSDARVPLDRREGRRKTLVPPLESGLLPAQADREAAQCPSRYGARTRQVFPASSETEIRGDWLHAEAWSHVVTGDRRIWLPDAHDKRRHDDRAVIMAGPAMRFMRRSRTNSHRPFGNGRNCGLRASPCKDNFATGDNRRGRKRQACGAPKPQLFFLLLLLHRLRAHAFNRLGLAGDADVRAYDLSGVALAGDAAVGP